MKFADVVQNGVLQAFGLRPRRRRVDPIPIDKARRLLKYKGERVTRSMVRGTARLQVIFD